MTRIVLATCVVLTLPSLAVAGPGPGPRPHGGGELRQDRRAIRDDLRDVERVNWLLREYAKNVTNHSRRGMLEIEARVAISATPV